MGIRLSGGIGPIRVSVPLTGRRRASARIFTGVGPLRVSAPLAGGGRRRSTPKPSSQTPRGSSAPQGSYAPRPIPGLYSQPVNYNQRTSWVPLIVICSMAVAVLVAVLTVAVLG